jgi:hypothetical protein
MKLDKIIIGRLLPVAGFQRYNFVGFFAVVIFSFLVVDTIIRSIQRLAVQFHFFAVSR